LPTSVYPSQDDIARWKESVKTDDMEYLQKVLRTPDKYIDEYVQIVKDEIIRRLGLDKVC